MRSFFCLLAICFALLSGCDRVNQGPLIVPDLQRGEPLAPPLVPVRLVLPDEAHPAWEVAMAAKVSSGQGGVLSTAARGPFPGLATPAVVDGAVYLGGGLLSQQFCAFDATTGQLLWEYKTADNGPTAAVVADGHVVFCTESCELEVLDSAGERIWKKLLGSPLLSMPAVNGGRIYTAYPDGSRNYHLLCVELKTGEELWNNPLPAEIITAPVVHDNLVLAATLDGTLSCFDAATGSAIWTELANATSAPAVANGVAYFGRRQEGEVSDGSSPAKLVSECIALRGLERRAPVRNIPGTERDPVLVPQGRSLFDQVAQALTGESVESVTHTRLSEAQMAEIWNYQGLKPFVRGANLYAAIDATLICVGLDDHLVRWKKEVRPAPGHETDAGNLLEHFLTPPAIVNGKLFLGTRDGRVLCLQAESGELLWSVEVGDPIVSQPAVFRGRVYLGTDFGSLIAVETGDPQDDGWLMWGGNAAHDGN